jgi:uncharacterized protein YjbI with pentapeptide repeats
MSAGLITFVTCCFYHHANGYETLFCLIPFSSCGLVTYFTFFHAKPSISSCSKQEAALHNTSVQLLTDASIELAAQSMESRISELNRLGTVAGDSPELLVPVLGALLGFVHREAGYGPRSKERDDKCISHDVQVALTLIGRLREEASAPPSLWFDLSWCDLRGARLPNVNFSGADLNHAILDDADLSGANLDSANLIDSSLQRTQLAEATLNMAVLFKANLSGAMLGNANLSDALLAGAILTNADIRRSSLQGAVLTSAQISEYAEATR